MPIATFDSWYKANAHYLETALGAVEQALENHIARLQNQPTEPTPDIQTALDAAAASMSRPPALQHLCSTFNLSPCERNILLLCVAQALFPYFPKLCAEAQGDEQLAFPTFHLALQLFPNFHWSALSPASALQHWQLVQIAPNQELPQSRLQIDNSILLYLMGEPYQDKQLLSRFVPLVVEGYSNTPLAPSHQHLAEQVAATFNSPIQNSKWTPPVVQLCGAEASDKWAIAAAACKMLERPLKVISARRLPTDAEELLYSLQRWEREVALTNSTLLLDCDYLPTADPARETAILQLIQETHTPLIISTEQRLFSPQRPLISFEVPKLTKSEQRTIWEANLGAIAHELNGQLDALVSQFNLSTPAIAAACLALKNLDSGSGSKEGGEKEQSSTANSQIQNQLWDFCRIQGRPRLDDLAVRIETVATWDKLVLPEQQKNTLKSIITHVQQRSKVYENWGFGAQSLRGLGIAALFAGPSGTGKTMAAEVLAAELHLDLYRIDLSAVVSKYIGETEKNLKRIFDAAEAGGKILLFDEADAIFGKRTDVKDSRDRYANQEVSYLLQRMEAYQGLAILTTNLKTSIDQAFTRRIRFIVNFPFPDATGRAEIWQRIFPSQTPTESLDFNKLGNLSVAGGNIRNIAVNAAFIAADAGEPVMMKHLLQATRTECVKLERSLTETEIRGWV